MIESNNIGNAVGIQRGDVIDRSQTQELPSVGGAVFTGRFKRGRIGKPFNVSSSNYRAMLGYDPSNPSYLAVEDAFARGLTQVEVLRVGGSSRNSWQSLPLNSFVTLDADSDGMLRLEAEINGITYNNDGMGNSLSTALYGLGIMDLLVGYEGVTFSNQTTNILNVKIKPQPDYAYTTKFIAGQGLIDSTGAFLFRLEPRGIEV